MASSYTCDGCGKTAPADQGWDGWRKPHVWFQRQDETGIQDACSRPCIDLIAKATGKTGVVLPV